MRLARGDDATIVKIAGESISLIATISAPPGASLEVTIDLRAGERLRVKVHGSKKQPDGNFIIDGRCVDMTRELRQELEALNTKLP
ncbi:MAG: hypothetical protein ABI183_01325 [Polyangiaceae bacterium]